MILETTAVILRVEEGSGRSKLVWALSPQHGRIICVFGSGKKFCEPGLFRVVNLKLEKKLSKDKFRYDDEGLWKAEILDLIHTYDQLAQNYDAFSRACDFGASVLQVSSRDHAYPLTFKTSLQALEAFLEGAEYLPWRVCMLINFLRDFGALPERSDLSDLQGRFLNRLLECSDDRKLLPNISSQKWLEFELWALSLLDMAGINVDFQ